MQYLASCKMFSSISSDMRTMSFAEVVKDRDSNVRVTADRLLYAVDLVTVMTGKNINHSNECLRDLNPSLFSNAKFVIRSRTKLLKYQDAIELVMVLPGKVAKEVRTKFADIIRRYYAGDKTLVGEINANAASDNAINRLARESMEAGDLERSKKRKWELEDLEIAERRMALQQGQAEVEAKILANAAKARDSVREHLTKVTNQYHELCKDTVIDERARLMLKDGFLNMAMAAQQGQPTQDLIQNGSKVSPNKPISITSVAKDLGLVIPDSEFKSIGIKASNRYNKLHGNRPEKHDQIIGGKVIPVCNYVESDRPLLEEVLREHCANK